MDIIDYWCSEAGRKLAEGLDQAECMCKVLSRRDDGRTFAVTARWRSEA